MRKVLVVGLDGATFDLLDSYVDMHPKGALACLRRTGIVRRLRSTIPFFTAPGWTTCLTGLPPDEHGVFHWRGRFDMRRGVRPLVATTHLDEAFLWWYVQHHGGRVSVTNFPMAYPAPATEGVFVCGTLSLEDAPARTWPPHLAARLAKEIPSYRYEIEKGLSLADQPDLLREHILQVGTNHLSAAVRFGAVESADLAVHVVTIIDRMHHYFWSSRHDPIADALVDAYALADEALGALLACGDWENVVVVSDHGAGPSDLVFYTDEWLIERGLAVRGTHGVDVALSTAYAGEEPEVAVYVNRLDRDGVGVSPEDYPVVVQNLCHGLRGVQLPGLDQPAFDKVLAASDIYAGPLRDVGPDVYLLPSEGCHPRPGLPGGLIGEPGHLVSGHRLDGIFMAMGVDVPSSPDPGGTRPIEMAEVFSVLCAVQGLPIPGGVVRSPLLDDLGIDHTVDFRLDWRQQVSGSPPRQKDSPAMIARLAEMGYL